MTGTSGAGADLGDPSLFLHEIDLGSGRGGFARAGRAELSAAPFLDHRWRAPDAVQAWAPLGAMQAADAEPPRLDFIWHTSYCASTLLSTCLDAPGRCLALKEPRALVILAAAKRSGRLGPPGGLAKSVLGLLARRFDPEERILVKPSNSANNLLPEVAALTRGRMLLLHSDCESFILSMARQGQAGFAYVRDRFTSLAADGHPAGRWPAGDLLKLTDLELAALVWRMQMDALEAASAQLGDRARSLDCRLFLEDPGLVLSRIDDFLGLGLGPERLDEVAEGPLLRSDAKRPGEAFNSRARTEEQAQLRAHLGRDLSSVLQAMDSAFPRRPALALPLVAPDAGRHRTDALAAAQAATA